VIAARIAHLSEVRLANIEQKLRWGFASDRESVQQDLDRLETEIGLWLDRLETGDYGDQVEASRHLANLNRVDSEIFLISISAGKPRARSSRLSESIDRLTVGSAHELLADPTSRATTRTVAGNANILQEALGVGVAEENWRKQSRR
jgi:hypothetical protein